MERAYDPHDPTLLINILTPHEMAPVELRSLRASMGLSQPQLSGLLGVSERTVTRWEGGKIGIPPYLRLALEHLAHCPGVPESAPRGVVPIVERLVRCCGVRSPPTHLPRQQPAPE